MIFIGEICRVHQIKKIKTFSENVFFNFDQFLQDNPKLKLAIETQPNKVLVKLDEKLFPKLEITLSNPKYHIQLKEASGEDGPNGWKIDPDLLAGLLDYYNSRAVSFASLLVASIFGLITLSAIIQAITFKENFALSGLQVPIGISVFLYVLFSGAGLYMLQGYSYYTSMADKIKSEALQRPYFYDLKRLTIWDESNKRYTNLVETFCKAEREHGKSFPKNIVQHSSILKIIFIVSLALLALFLY